MKEIDEELVSQINAVFENFDDGASESGWAKLREKYPEKQNKKLPIWWISGIAAAILIVIGLFLTQDKPARQIENVEQIVKQQPIIKQKRDSIINSASVAKKEETKPTNISPENSAFKSPVATQKIAPQVSSVETPMVVDVKIAKVEPPIKNESITNQKIAVVQNPINPTAIIANKVDTVQKINNQSQVIANNTVTVKDPPIVKKTTEQFLNDQSKILAQKPKDVEKTKDSKSSIEIFSGTFLNYYADNAAKLNAGFGVNANLKLTKSLFFSFGAGVSQNKIEYQRSIPAEVSRSMYASSDVYSSPNNSSGSYSNATTISNVSINAQLLNFDIPISLKFYPTKKQNFYISTGINSNTYLSQKYTYGYNLNQVNALGITQTAKQEETQKSQVNGFDFATSAIFAIGINQNIGKNSLTFEPYFKPAIRNMGEKNLRINTVGINLKFNFTSTNK